MFFLCFLLLSRYIEKRKLGFSSSLYAWNHFPLIAPKGNILLIDVTLPFFQLPYQPAFRYPAMALQSENAHIIAQNAQKQCIIFKLPERITTLSKVTPQQRIGLCLAQVLGQCLPRKQAMPVTDVRHLSPMPAFIVMSSLS